MKLRVSVGTYMAGSTVKGEVEIPDEDLEWRSDGHREEIYEKRAREWAQDHIEICYSPVDGPDAKE